MRRLYLTLFLAGLFTYQSMGQDIKDIQGSWIAEINDYSSVEALREASLTMRWESEGERYRYTFRIPMSELEEFAVEQPSDDDANFELEREAGHLSFSGTMDDDLGSGEFTFSANPEFLSQMASLGYENISSDEQLKMAIYDVTTDFVKRIRSVSDETES